MILLKINKNKIEFGIYKYNINLWNFVDNILEIWIKI